MKTLLFSLLFIATSFFNAHAQVTNSSDVDKVTEQVESLFRQGNFVEAAKLAEKVIKQKRNGDPEELASALIDLAVIKKEEAKKHLFSNEKDPLSRVLEIGKFRKSAEDSEGLFSEVIDIYRNRLKVATPQLALVLDEIAWLTANNIRASLKREAAEKRLQDAENYYYQALTLKERLWGPGHESTRKTLLELADFQFSNLDLESALKSYTNYLRIADAAGVAKPQLVRPLRALALIQASTGQEADAAATCAKITESAGQPEKLPDTNFVLAKRRIFGAKDRVEGALYMSAVMVNPIIGPHLMLLAGAGLFVGGGPMTYTGGDLRYGNAVFPSSPVMANHIFLPSYSSKRVRPVYVKVLVDEQGLVSEAAADTKEAKLGAKAEKEVLKWKFRPFVYEGVARKIRGWVIYYAA